MKRQQEGDTEYSRSAKVEPERPQQNGEFEEYRCDYFRQTRVDQRPTTLSVKELRAYIAPSGHPGSIMLPCRTQFPLTKSNGEQG
ncbi:hypothetical protein BaRGS_00021116 [Batillaria attramentaria]|uniref:Uncharacterized protein n=1 Tax=Batillaria attramentaria TaxID=370345 RepID=A0ABD0KKS1_9CAEN